MGLTDQIQEVQNENEVVQDRDMMLQIQTSELEHEKREKQAQLEEREKEREAEAEPKIKEARNECEILQKEIELMRQQKEGYQSRLEEYTVRCKEVEEEIESNKALYKSHELEYNKIKGDPDRIRKQAEKFENAVNALAENQRQKVAEIEQTNEKIRKNNAMQKETEEQRAKKQMRLQLMTESSKITDQSCDDVRKRLEREKNIYNELTMKRVSLDQELDELNVEYRLAVAEQSQLHKQFERLKRQYRKTQLGKEAVEEALGPLQTQKKDLTKQAKARLAARCAEADEETRGTRCSAT